MDESQRIAQVYGDRGRTLKADYYSCFETSNLHRLQGRERATLRLLARHGLTDLAPLKILEVGCGSGGELLRFVAWGADPAKLAGVDLLVDRVSQARRLLPEADLRSGDARELPFADASVDLIAQLTVFSSVLDPAIRLAIATEMKRVLKPGGHILWYDMRVVRPGRPLVAMGRSELRRLFGRWAMDVEAVTLNPVVARLTCPISWALSDALALLPGLKSHYLALISAPS